MSSLFFTTDDGDVILRAGHEPSPRVDFCVHKFILSLASPVFKDMFTFPQPPAENNKERPEIPIVDVPDSPQTLDMILRFIYPGAEFPRPTDISTVSALLFAADKYNITSIRPVLWDALGPFTNAEPFRVYIIACRFGFLEEAKAAARMLTPKTIVLPKDHEKDARHISGVDLYRLLWFSKTREDMVRSKIEAFTSPTTGVSDVCPDHRTEHRDFYTQLGRKLQEVFAKNPCAKFDDFNSALGTLPDPPLGCPPGLQYFGRGVRCPLRPSFIRHRLTLLAVELNDMSDTLVESAFEKEF